MWVFPQEKIKQHHRRAILGRACTRQKRRCHDIPPPLSRLIFLQQYLTRHGSTKIAHGYQDKQQSIQMPPTHGKREWRSATTRRTNDGYHRRKQLQWWWQRRSIARPLHIRGHRCLGAADARLLGIPGAGWRATDTWPQRQQQHWGAASAAAGKPTLRRRIARLPPKQGGPHLRLW